MQTSDDEWNGQTRKHEMHTHTQATQTERESVSELNLQAPSTRIDLAFSSAWWLESN